MFCAVEVSDFNTIYCSLSLLPLNAVVGQTARMMTGVTPPIVGALMPPRHPRIKGGWASPTIFLHRSCLSTSGRWAIRMQNSICYKNRWVLFSTRSLLP